MYFVGWHDYGKYSVLMTTRFILLSIIFILFCGISAHAGSEGSDRGGGDPYSHEFTSVARKSLRFLYENKACVPPELSLLKLQESIDTTLVLSKKKTYLEKNVEVSAINFPQACIYGETHLPQTPCIIVNQGSWDEMKNNVSRIVKLSLHEYFGIMKLNDQRYKFSEKMEDCLQKSIQNYEARYSPAKEVLVSFSDVITGTDDGRATCLIFTEGTGEIIDLTYNPVMKPLAIDRKKFNSMIAEIKTLPAFPQYKKEVIPTYSMLWSTEEALDQVVIAPGLIYPEYSSRFQYNNPSFVSLPKSHGLTKIIKDICHL